MFPENVFNRVPAELPARQCSAVTRLKYFMETLFTMRVHTELRYYVFPPNTTRLTFFRNYSFFKRFLLWQCPQSIDYTGSNHKSQQLAFKSIQIQWPNAAMTTLANSTFQRRIIKFYIQSTYYRCRKHLSFFFVKFNQITKILKRAKFQKIQKI